MAGPLCVVRGVEGGVGGWLVTGRLSKADMLSVQRLRAVDAGCGWSRNHCISCWGESDEVQVCLAIGIGGCVESIPGGATTFPCRT